MSDSNSWGRSPRHYDWGQKKSDSSAADAGRSQSEDIAGDKSHQWGQSPAANVDNSGTGGESSNGSGSQSPQQPAERNRTSYGWEKQDKKSSSNGAEYFGAENLSPRKTQQVFPETTSFPPISTANRPAAQGFHPHNNAQFHAPPSDYSTIEESAFAAAPAASTGSSRKKGMPLIIGAVVVAAAAVAGGISWAAISADQSHGGGDNVAEATTEDQTKQSSTVESPTDEAQVAEQERTTEAVSENAESNEEQPVQKSSKPQSSTGAHCGQDDAMTAFESGVSSDKNLGASWTFASDGYDPCLPLSWITTTVEGATASSPYHIMLYHYGTYKGTATLEPQAFAPRIEDVSDSEIAVTYRWPREGEGNANPSGRTYAGFYWSDTEGKVIMTGDVPTY